ncbi:unnamed protein product [Blepharisma stoltei]|uniref:HEPN domain-containing protein n=1 Tax=Blepharisma stoltei TaxID=1481888 RepID=A0AAU9JGP6_9CILI|nr:unnamed protein product [Blepharisma stoltei]
MESLTNDYFTIESIWLSIEAENLPEELGIDEETKSLAKFYYDSALSVIKFLLEIYQENRVLENQNEESHSRSYELCKATHNFKIPSILSRCFTYAYINPKNKKLKYLIEELDYACRNFEERIFEILHDYYLAIKLDNDD